MAVFEDSTKDGNIRCYVTITRNGVALTEYEDMRSAMAEFAKTMGNKIRLIDNPKYDPAVHKSKYFFTLE